jgi:hypothetical protein
MTWDRGNGNAGAAPLGRGFRYHISNTPANQPQLIAPGSSLVRCAGFSAGEEAIPVPQNGFLVPPQWTRFIDTILAGNNMKSGNRKYMP